jgi:hypothetical protein
MGCHGGRQWHRWAPPREIRTGRWRRDPDGEHLFRDSAGSRGDGGKLPVAAAVTASGRFNFFSFLYCNAKIFYTHLFLIFIYFSMFLKCFSNNSSLIVLPNFILYLSESYVHNFHSKVFYLTFIVVKTFVYNFSKIIKTFSKKFPIVFASFFKSFCFQILISTMF